MNGLESRLQAVDGVEEIELELGDDGLEGITVRLAEGADEALVLDGVRRLLVAYGTKAPRVPAAFPAKPADGPHPDQRPSAPPRPESDESGDRAHNEAATSDASNEDMFGQSVTATAPNGDTIQLGVSSGADETTALVSLVKGDRVVRRQVPASARAIVQAVIDAGTEVTGLEPVSVIGLNVSSVDRTRILTVIAGNHGTSPKVCTASVVESNWAGALMDVLLQILTLPSRSL